MLARFQAGVLDPPDHGVDAGWICPCRAGRQISFRRRPAPAVSAVSRSWYLMRGDFCGTDGRQAVPLCAGVRPAALNALLIAAIVRYRWFDSNNTRRSRETWRRTGCAVRQPGAHAHGSVSRSVQSDHFFIYHHTWDWSFLKLQQPIPESMFTACAGARSKCWCSETKRIGTSIRTTPPFTANWRSVSGRRRFGGLSVFSARQAPPKPPLVRSGDSAAARIVNAGLGFRCLRRAAGRESGGLVRHVSPIELCAAGSSIRSR